MWCARIETSTYVKAHDIETSTYVKAHAKNRRIFNGKLVLNRKFSKLPSPRELCDQSLFTIILWSVATPLWTYFFPEAHPPPCETHNPPPLACFVQPWWLHSCFPLFPPCLTQNPPVLAYCVQPWWLHSRFFPPCLPQNSPASGVVVQPGWLHSRWFI